MKLNALKRPGKGLFLSLANMKNLFLVFALLYSQLIWGQAEPGMESALFRLERGTFNSQQGMIGRKIPPAEVKGDYYLNSDWNEGTFTMKDGRKSATYPLRYDVENAVLEIQWGSQVKVVGEEFLAKFGWQEQGSTAERVFVNGRKFSLSETPVSGFLELAYQGRDSLLVVYDTYLKQPDYVAGLDMGSRHPEIVKTQKYFIAEDGVLREIKNRRDFLNYADQMSGKKLKSWFRDQNMNLKRVEDLIRLMKYYESNIEGLE